MALSFRKVVRLAIPAVPKNLSTWGGRGLPPLLLVALQLNCSTYLISSVVMKFADGDLSGLYCLVVALASQKIYSLYFASSLSGSLFVSKLPYFSNLQNALGFCFIIVGNMNYICALYCLHIFLYILNISLVRRSFFPNARLVCLYCYLAFLH